jgi:hypothetical protein
MDSNRFDAWTRALETATSRRTLLLGLVAAALFAPLTGLDLENAAAKKHHHKKHKKHKHHGGSDDCPSGQTLCDTECISDDLCCDDADCASGQRCLGNGGCAFDCTDDILNCPGSAEGDCACFADTDGSKVCGATNLFCEDEVFVECTVDADCEPGFQCSPCGEVNKCMPLCIT